MTIDEMRAEKKRLLAVRNENGSALVDGVRNEMLNMADCIRLYNTEYSNIDLIETFKRWAEDLGHASTCIEVMEDEKDKRAFWKYEEDEDDE